MVAADNNNRVEEVPADTSCRPPRVDDADDRGGFDSSVRNIDQGDMDNTDVDDRRGVEDTNLM